MAGGSVGWGLDVMGVRLVRGGAGSGVAEVALAVAVILVDFDGSSVSLGTPVLFASSR